MSFDLSWDTLAVLEGGMRIHYSGADPARDSGCTELLPALLSLIGINKRRLPFLKIWLASWDHWNVPWVIDLIRSPILLHELGAKK